MSSKRALLDTSILIADTADLSGLLGQISAVSYAELHFGVNAASDENRKAARQHRLTLIQATYGHGLAFDDFVAHHYGLLCGRLKKLGRSPRGRVLDIMIAATALAHDVALVTRNTTDVDNLGVEIITR